MKRLGFIPNINRGEKGKQTHLDHNHQEEGNMAPLSKEALHTHKEAKQTAFPTRPDCTFHERKEKISAVPRGKDLSEQLDPADSLPTFICDVHLGKLSRILRLLGFSVYYRNDLEDGEIADRASASSAIVLSRDRGLLQRKKITKSLLLTSTDPYEQAREVLWHFNLLTSVRPFSRCSACGALINPISREAVYYRLPPRVREKYTTFYQCSSCGKLFWKGDHFRTLEGLLNRLLSSIPE
ncbi:MAG: Mut7-C RNAse domain-containing protein [Treponemataceae bacterium]|nr:Mut7-C RNAse domain-containing protein [Treponemataceae bacterium]